MDKEQLKEQLAETKAKVQEKIAHLTELAKEGVAEAKEEIEEQIAYLKSIDFSDQLEKLGEEASEEFQELKAKAATAVSSLKERFKDWF